MSADLSGVDQSAEHDPPAALLEELPPAVRSRIVALTADVLPALAQPPVALRRVATFAPARRARLGDLAIRRELIDDDFRDRVGQQLAGRVPAPDAAQGRGGAGDLVEGAALAWLVRPDDWEATLATALRVLQERDEALMAAREAGELDQLRARVEDLERQLRGLQEEHRAELGRMRSEHADLRRRIGDARALQRQAAAAAFAAEQAHTDATSRAEAADAELRRLRAQLAEAQAVAVAARRSTRDDRDDATLRARLLLDVVLEATQGLRRELALPTLAGEPADKLEAALADTGAVAAPDAARVADPALLEQRLQLPRARLIVDGYNVSMAGKPNSALDMQRSWLVTQLAALAARTGARATVVFDAAQSSTRPSVVSPRGVTVRFSPPGVIADDVIRDLVGAEPPGRPVVVVTSDQALARDVAATGARAVPAAALLGLLR